MSSEAINLIVDYVNGSKYPHQFYIELQCASKTLAELLNGSFGLISGVPPNEMCTLRVTDGNAAGTIRTKAAFTIMKITVPAAAGAIVYNNSSIISSIASTSAIPGPTTGRSYMYKLIFDFHCTILEVQVPIAEPLVLSPSIAAFTVAIIGKNINSDAVA